jgi:hypothetical protein
MNKLEKNKLKMKLKRQKMMKAAALIPSIKKR